MKRILAWLLVATPALAGDNLLRNPSFEEWKDGAPAEWTVADGASKGAGAASKVEKGAEGGIALSGDAGTQVWKVVRQDVAVKPGGYYRLKFESRGTGIKTEFGQFASRYVGLWAGKGSPQSALVDVANGPWAETSVYLIHAKGATISVQLFLGQTGKLEARKLAFEELVAADSGDVLIDRVARAYPMLELKKIDWPAAAAKFREDLRSAKDENAFLDAAAELLKTLRDQHVHFVGTKGALVPTFVPSWTDNFDFASVKSALTGITEIPGVGFAGTSADGFAYISIGTYTFGEPVLKAIQDAIDARLDAPGFIVDVRHNAGGSELAAQRVAAIFADKKRAYARHRCRIGPRPGDLSDPADMTVQPRDGKTFTKPVVLLTGSRCISAGENFVEMMKTFPHVTLVGQPTCGSTGNPQPFELPNGVVAWISSVLETLPDGTPTEGQGIAPDVVVEHKGPGDPTFEKAVEILKEKMKK